MKNSFSALARADFSRMCLRMQQWSYHSRSCLCLPRPAIPCWFYRRAARVPPLLFLQCRLPCPPLSVLVQCFRRSSIRLRRFVVAVIGSSCIGQFSVPDIIIYAIPPTASMTHYTIRSGCHNYLVTRQFGDIDSLGSRLFSVRHCCQFQP